MPTGPNAPVTPRPPPNLPQLTVKVKGDTATDAGDNDNPANAFQARLVQHTARLPRARMKRPSQVQPDLASQVRAKLQRPQAASSQAPQLAPLLAGCAEERPQLVASSDIQAAADRWNLAGPPTSTQPASLQPAQMKRPSLLPTQMKRPGQAPAPPVNRSMQPSATASAFLPAAFAAPAAAPEQAGPSAAEPPPPPPRTCRNLREGLSQASCIGKEDAESVPIAKASATRFAGLVPTSVRRTGAGRGASGGRGALSAGGAGRGGGEGQSDAARSRGEERGAAKGEAEGAALSAALWAERGAAEGAAAAEGVAEDAASAPLWRTLDVHEACEARLGGTWRAVAVVGVTHQGYEIARYRVRTVAPDEQRGGGGLIDVHELSASEVRRFQETRLDAGPVCTFYAEHGTCKRGARCPYAHVPSARTRPSPEEVAAAIAAAKADRAAARRQRFGRAATARPWPARGRAAGGRGRGAGGRGPAAAPLLP